MQIEISTRHGSLSQPQLDYLHDKAEKLLKYFGRLMKIEVEVGNEVAEGDTVVILESMKMEMPVEAEGAGKVAEIRCEEGQSVSEGDVLVVLA